MRHKLLPLAGIGVVLLVQGWVSMPAEEAVVVHHINRPKNPQARPTLSAPPGESRRAVESKRSLAVESGPTPLMTPSAGEPLPTLELPAQPNAFLKANLRVVGEVFPEMYERYLGAPPRMRGKLAHALLTYSMTIILSASGEGPLPEGHPMSGVLTGATLDGAGLSAFHINDCTFQYHLDRFPETLQYRRNRAGQRRFGPVGIRPLPLGPALDQAILDRAAEAFSYLD
jgi:hypothetical protein